MGSYSSTIAATAAALWLTMSLACARRPSPQAAEPPMRNGTEMPGKWSWQPGEMAPAALDVPEGLQFMVKLEKELTTSNVVAGDTWDGTLTRDTLVRGRTAWRAGTEVRGLVVQSIPPGKLIGGQGGLGIKVTILGHDYVKTPTYLIVSDKTGSRNARFVDGGAGYGALMAILSDGKLQEGHEQGGAAIGAACGAFLALFPNHGGQKLPPGGGETVGAAGTATSDEVMIRIPIEKVIVFNLAVPVKIMPGP